MRPSSDLGAPGRRLVTSCSFAKLLRVPAPGLSAPVQIRLDRDVVRSPRAPGQGAGRTAECLMAPLVAPAGPCPGQGRF